jgi:WD40 repeat protein
VQFSPDSQTLVANRDYPEVAMWDVRSGTAQKPIAGGHPNFISSLAFSPDGKILATGAYDKTIRFWSLNDGQEIGTPLMGHRLGIISLAFSPDGKLLASASWDETIGVWDIISRRQIATLTNHTAQVTSVAFSPDQKILASSSADFSIKLWDTASWAEVNTLRGNLDEVWSLVFSQDGKTLISGGKDGIVRTWRVAPRFRKPELLQRPVDAEDWGLRSGFLFCTHTNGSITYWDAATLHQISRYVWNEEARTNRLTFDLSRGGKLVWTNKKNEVIVWDLNVARELIRFPWVPGTDKLLRVSPDEKLLIGVSAQVGRLTIWDLEHSKEIASLPKSIETDPAARSVSNLNEVGVVSFSPDSPFVACGNWNGTVEVWDLARRERIADWIAHQEPIADIGFLPGGKNLISMSEDATAKAWEIASAQQIKSFDRTLNSFDSLSVAPDGKRVAALAADSINIWNPVTGRTVALLNMQWPDQRFDARGLQFLQPDGNVLLAYGASQAVLWRAASFREIEVAEARGK